MPSISQESLRSLVWGSLEETRPSIVPSYQNFQESLRAATEPSLRDDNQTTTSQEEFEMATVSDVFGQSFPVEEITGHPLIVGTNRVGVEIELENIRESYPASRYWRTESDGSLRDNGCEFVFRGPLGGKNLFEALIEVDSFLHKNNPSGSWRCSTHVHVDVRDMTAQQLKYMFLAYLVYEQMLFRCSGFERYKNNFCPALGFAQQMIQVLSNNWAKSDRNFMRGIQAGWDKYSAMNLVPMAGYGSVEFRMAGAKWRKGHLTKHCNRLLSLKDLAMSWEGTEEELVLHLVHTDPNTIVKKGLPKKFDIDNKELEIGAKLAFDVLRLSRLREKTREKLAGQYEGAGNTPVEIVRLHGQPSLEDIFQYVAGHRRVAELDWWDNNWTEFPSTLTFKQISDLARCSGLAIRWLIDREQRQAYNDYVNALSDAEDGVAF